MLVKYLPKLEAINNYCNLHRDQLQFTKDNIEINVQCTYLSARIDIKSYYLPNSKNHLYLNVIFICIILSYDVFIIPLVYYFVMHTKSNYDCLIKD